MGDSDLEKMKKMLDRADVVFRTKANEDGGTYLSVEAHDGPNNEGYNGFVVAMNFNKDGKLLNVGAWE